MPSASDVEPTGNVSSPKRSWRPVRVAALLFIFLNCVYLLTSTGRVRTIDEIHPVMQSESLLLRHSTAIPQAVRSGTFFGKWDRHGVPRSAWPVGQPVLVLPWTAFGDYVLAKLPGMPADISDLVLATGVCWSNATYAAIAGAASFLLFLGMGLHPRPALACSLILGFATPLFVYSGWLYTEPIITALFLLGTFLLFGTGGGIGWQRALAGAVVLGFSIHVRPNAIVTVLIFVIAAALFDHARPIKGFRYRITGILVVVIALSGVIYLARNYALFGNMLDFGVPDTAENGKDLNSWHNPLWLGILGFLFSPGKSIFLFCPPVILGVLGLRRLWASNRALAFVCGAAPLVNLLFFSRRTQWEAGYCYGPRYLVPSLVLLTLPMAALFRTPPRWLRPAVWIAGLTGFAVQAIGLSTNILEDMVRNHYFIGNWDYRMSYSPITGQLSLIWKYLHAPSPALGLGWDRWWVFLRMAGADPRPLYGIAGVFLMGALLFGWLTWKSIRSQPAD